MRNLTYEELGVLCFGIIFVLGFATGITGFFVGIPICVIIIAVKVVTDLFDYFKKQVVNWKRTRCETQPLLQRSNYPVGTQGGKLKLFLGLNKVKIGTLLFLFLTELILMISIVLFLIWDMI